MAKWPNCSRCNQPIQTPAHALLLKGKQACRECCDDFAPKCPSCHGDLPCRPTRKQPCPLCNKTIWVNSNQWLHPSRFLNQRQRNELETLKRLRKQKLVSHDGQTAFIKERRRIRQAGLTEQPFDILMLQAQVTTLTHKLNNISSTVTMELSELNSIVLFVWEALGILDDLAKRNGKVDVRRDEAIESITRARSELRQAVDLWDGVEAGT